MGKKLNLKNKCFGKRKAVATAAAVKRFAGEKIKHWWKMCVCFVCIRAKSISLEGKRAQNLSTAKSAIFKCVCDVSWLHDIVIQKQKLKVV